MDLRVVCQFLNEARLRQERCVLVTVCAVEGSSMRNPGTIMGVAESGTFAGSLSGGCIENAVVAEALEVLKSGEPRIVRFGKGSPYVDIRLPCGGGLDLHFCLLEPGDDLAGACLASLQAREPFAIQLGHFGAVFLSHWRPALFDAQAGEAVFGYWPGPRLQIIGHGTGVETLADQAEAMGCETRVLTPDERIAASLKKAGYHPILLKRRSDVDALESDPWTATVFLFHDHDWEIELIERALALPHFYLGAMGGKKAHAMRVEELLKRKVDLAAIANIRAPIGIFHSSRDPHTLALSTLAEVIQTYQQIDFEADLG